MKKKSFLIIVAFVIILSSILFQYTGNIFGSQFGQANILFSILEKPQDILQYNGIQSIIQEQKTRKISSSAKNPIIAQPQFAKTDTNSDAIVIALIDTGIDLSHPLLRKQVWTNQKEFFGLEGIDDVYGYDFLKNSPDPTDTDGHGTHLAGILIGKAYNKQIKLTKREYIYIMPLRITHGKEMHSRDAPKLVSEAIDYAIDNGADIVHLSLGLDKSYNEVKSSINKAEAKGIITVAASGNDGKMTTLYPAGYENVIAVSSKNMYSVRSNFANYGKHIDTYALGENIFSSSLNNFYEFRSGTSQAAALVSYAVANSIQENPKRSITEVIERIESNPFISGK